MFKNVLKLTMVIVFGLSLNGCAESPYAKAESATYDVYGTPVVVEADGMIIKGDVDEMIDMIESMPQYLVNNADTIYIVGDDRFVQEHNEDEEIIESKESVLNSVSGFYEPWNNVVFLRTSSKHEETIAHELWHSYDMNHGTPELEESETFEWQSLYNAAPYSISEYGATDACEFFAEAGEDYILNPEELMQKNMEVYNYFEALSKDSTRNWQ